MAGKIIKGTIFAGLLPGVVSPILWPFVVLFFEGRWPDWSIYPMAVVGISFFAILIGLPCCIALGSPALFALDKLNLNTPTIAGIAGSVIAISFYFLLAHIHDYPPVSKMWPLAAFFACNGMACGAMASLGSRQNQSVN